MPNLLTPMLWRGAPSGPIQSPSLAQRAAAQGILYGGTTNVNYMNDLDYIKYAASEYGGGVITSEIANWNHIETAQNSFDFSSLDRELTMFPANNKPVVRLYFGNNYAGWVSGAIGTVALAKAVLTNHATKLAAHWPYPTITYINLVNECIKPFSGDSLGFQSDIFKTILGNSFSTGYIATMYQICRAAWGPNVKLGLNFNHLEPEEGDDSPQRALILAAYQGFKNAGFPMQWMGNEFHGNNGVVVSNQGAVASFYSAIANLGSEIHLTELDCNDLGVGDIKNSDRDAANNTNLLASLQTAINNPACTVVQSWADNDRYNWECYPTPPDQFVGRNDGVVGRTALKDWAFRKKAIYDNLGALFDGANRVAGTRHDVTVVIGQASSIITPLSVSSPVVMNGASVAVVNSTGNTHEPPNYIMQLTAGPMTTVPAVVDGGTWIQGVDANHQPLVWTNDSPTTPVPHGTAQDNGQWAGNISRDASGSGLKVSYPPALNGGGFSPTRFGPAGFVNIGSGGLYIRFLITFSSNWQIVPGNNGCKLFDIHLPVAGHVNHIIDTAIDVSITDAFIYLALQGPDVPTVNVPQLSGPQTWTSVEPLAQLAGATAGSQHKVELLVVQDNPAGAGNGAFTSWIDGTLAYSQTGVKIIGATSPRGWGDIFFDPTYGGGINSPPNLTPQIAWTIDQFYASVSP